MATPHEKPSGRLELTWANKRRRLIAREDGSYEWVPQGDYRAREVRLLREAGAVGSVSSDPLSGPGGNLLVRGDSLHALNALTGIPAFADELVGKVKLIYIDPPFNTGEAFSQYDDGLEHSVWLTMMRDRLTQLKRLLAPDGSIWVHLDDNEQAYCRVLMDEVFGRSNFVASLTVQMNPKGRQLSPFFATSHDYVLVYAASRDRVALRGGSAENVNPADYPHDDGDGRKFRLLPLRNTNKKFNPQTRPNLHYPLYADEEGAVFVDPGPGRTEVRPIFGDGSDAVWRWQKSTADAQREQLSARVVEGRTTGSRLDVFQRDYLTEGREKKYQSIWMAEEIGSTDSARLEIRALELGEDFATPKPEQLLSRVVSSATNPGDIVLDCFAGSGTTAAVAHKMGRRWVTVEWERETLETFIVPRLEKVVRGDDPGGITEAMGWEGGGGFWVLDVAPSMYEDDEGVIVLADWATDNALAEAVAAQLGFEYAPDGPYCGRQGRTRLAVLDGHLTKDAARMLLAGLGPNENLSVVAVGLDPDADALLRKERPGSRARVAPRDLLLTYAQPAAWQISAAPLVTAEMEEQLAELEQLDLLADGGAQ